MNTEQYISSGILEAYAIGDVSAIEKEEVEKKLKQYPELKVELELIERTMEQLAMCAAIQPKASVKVAIISQIDAADTKVITFTSNSIWRYATAASIAIALFASYMAYHYYNRWEMTSVALSDLIAQNQQIAQDYNVVNEKLDKIQNDFSIIENAAFTKVVMSGTKNSPASLASVYWNSNTQEVYLSIQNLKELSEANQFQLWAIVDGKPVDAGVFDSNTEGLTRMKSISGASAFAVTIEPRGGNLSPSLETMQVMGGLSKG
ncbi:MAG: anti-sigma factor [Cyclobacteriaceae bacterium]